MERLINNKKYLTFILIGLLTLVIGISLSFIMFDLSGRDNSIQTGQISMTYTEPSSEVILKDQVPITDEIGMNQDKYFEFSVMSNATTNEDDDRGVTIPYEISISKVAVDASKKQLEDKDVKIYLTKLEGEKEEVVLGEAIIAVLSEKRCSTLRLLVQKFLGNGHPHLDHRIGGICKIYLSQCGICNIVFYMRDGILFAQSHIVVDSSLFFARRYGVLYR